MSKSPSHDYGSALHPSAAFRYMDPGGRGGVNELARSFDNGKFGRSLSGNKSLSRADFESVAVECTERGTNIQKWKVSSWTYFERCDYFLCFGLLQ
jgi:hypothetical protein